MGQPIPIAKKFAGLNNKVDPARLELNLETLVCECSQSVNLKYDETGRPRLRRGQVPRHVGNFHSLWTFQETYGYVGLDNLLYKLNDDLSLTGVRDELSGSRIAFCWTPLGIYYANGTQKGILQGDRSLLWEQTEGRKRSPRHYTGPPDKGLHIELFSQCLLVSEGNVVYRSQPNNYGLFRKSADHSVFPGPVRMMKAVAGGVYWSDDARTYFTPGNDPREWVRRTVMECPAMEWSAIPDLINPKDIGMEGDDGWACWVSAEGIVYGSPQGNIIQPTKDKIRLPSGFQQGAAIMDGHNCIYNMHQ